MMADCTSQSTSQRTTGQSEHSLSKQNPPIWQIYPQNTAINRREHHLCMDFAIMHTHYRAECNKIDILSTNLSIKITSDVIWDTEISTYATLKKFLANGNTCAPGAFFSFSNSTQIFIVTLMGCCISSTHKSF